MCLGCSDADLYDVMAGLHDNAPDVFLDAIRSLPRQDDTKDIDYISGITPRVRSGELFAFTLLDHGCPVGVICYKARDGEADLVFGHVMCLFKGIERFFLSAVVVSLLHSGVKAIRSGFRWPSPKAFIGAATDMGFREIPRMSMSVKASTMEVEPPEGIVIVPWSATMEDEVGSIMSDCATADDRAIYPLFSSQEGSIKLLHSIIGNGHGIFLPGFSYAALKGNEVAGFVLASLLADGSVLVLDIAVRERYRRSGIGGALMRGLIGACAASGKQRVVLAVSENNAAAIALYKKLGFKKDMQFSQYVLFR